ncbi:MAG: hypothetical protein IJP96_13325 [Synergistaceae bacterium]|nr:hypothetical protein [Synergistaceae bacterium]MBR0315479.1 hypothetical protein [Synergistaceae bacterium]
MTIKLLKNRFYCSGVIYKAGDTIPDTQTSRELAGKGNAELFDDVPKKSKPKKTENENKLQQSTPVNTESPVENDAGTP